LICISFGYDLIDSAASVSFGAETDIKATYLIYEEYYMYVCVCACVRGVDYEWMDGRIERLSDG